MKFFLVYKLIGELERRANIVHGDAVFTTQLVEAHSSGKPAYEPGYWNTRALDDGLSMLNFRINDDAFHTERSVPLLVRDHQQLSLMGTDSEFA
jgi:hypothetical protein